MKINFRHFILSIFALAALAGSVLGYTVLYKSAISEAQKSSLAFREVAIENEKKLYEAELSTLYNESKIDRERAHRIIVSQTKIVGFIKDIENIGTLTSTDLTLTSIDAPDLSGKEDDFVSATEGTIQVVGSWTNVMRALILIENMPYSLTLSNIKLTTSVVSGDTPKCATATKCTGSHQWSMILNFNVLSTK